MTMKECVFMVVLCVAPILFSATRALTPLAQRQNTSTPKTKVDIRYDKKKDMTTAELEELILWKNPSRFEKVSMFVGFEYPKRIIATPKFVSLVFESATRDWDPFPVDDVVATSDGARFELGKMAPRKGSLYRAGDVIERRRITISYLDFSRIAKAKKAAILIGDRKYDLTERHLQLLTDFLELMQQEGKEFK